MSADGRVRHALFDFGGPLLLSPFELRHVAADRLGVEPGELPGGPFDPDDLRWEARRQGVIDERQYWSEVAERFRLDLVGLMRCFFEPSGDHLVRRASWDLVEALLTAGRKVGLLTNDLTAFHDPGWHDAITVLRRFDPLVDLSASGRRKPHPEAYQAGIEAMDMEPERIVFIDDQVDNLAAAADAGLIAVFFDVTDPDASLRRARRALDGGDL